MKIIPIDSPRTLHRLMVRRLSVGVPDDLRKALFEAVQVQLFADAIGILRTASVLWKWQANRSGDRVLARVAKIAFDIAECKQVVTAGEDL